MVTLSLFIFSYATSMIFPPQQRFLRTPYRDRTHFCILNQSITLQTALQLFLGHRIHSAKRQPATAYVHPHRIHGTFYGNGIDTVSYTHLDVYKRQADGYQYPGVAVRYRHIITSYSLQYVYHRVNTII